MSAIEDRYGVDLDETEVTEKTTVTQLDQMLQGRSGQKTTYVYPRWALHWSVGWLRAIIYHLVTWPATMLLAKPRVRGQERLEGVKGPVLIVCNHVTYIDIGFILAALLFLVAVRAISLWVAVSRTQAAHAHSHDGCVASWLDARVDHRNVGWRCARDDHELRPAGRCADWNRFWQCCAEVCQQSRAEASNYGWCVAGRAGRAWRRTTVAATEHQARRPRRVP